MDQQMQMSEEEPEMKALDAIIAKVQDMVKGGQIDPEEILMDLEDFKMLCKGEDSGTENESESAPSEGMAGMIDKMGAK